MMMIFLFRTDSWLVNNILIHYIGVFILYPLSMKQCIICKQVKPYSEYYKHPATKDWYLTKCKECQKQNSRFNRSAEKDRIRYQKNPKRRLQIIFRDMLNRCNNPNNIRYNRYWMLGVKVLRATYQDFIADMLPSYIKHYEENKDRWTKRMTQIDRIDVTGNYCKNNCRWVTPKQQANNRRMEKPLVV